MQVEMKTDGMARIRELEGGNTFQFEGDVYICSYFEEEDRCYGTNLVTGRIFCFSDNQLVKPVKMKGVEV